MSSAQPFYLPDEECYLRCCDCCVRNDAPWLLPRIKREGLLYLAHPRFTPEHCQALGINRLSDVVQEHLACQPVAVAGDRSSRLTTTLHSLEFASALQDVIHHCHPTHLTTPDQLHQTLALHTIHIVAKLRTSFTLQGVDITADWEGSHSYTEAHKHQLFVIDHPQLDSFLARSVCRILDVPLLPYVAELLECDPTSIFSLLSTLAVPSSHLASTHTHRGLPGHPLPQQDVMLLQLRPRPEFFAGEVVAWKDANKAMRYGQVLRPVDIVSEAELASYVVQLGPAKSASLLASDIYGFRAEAPSGGAVTPAQSSNHNRTQAILAVDESSRNDIVTHVSSMLGRLGVDVSLDTQQMLRQVADLNQKLLESRAKCNELATQMQRMEAQEAAHTAERVCPICFTNAIDSLLLDCGHCLCGVCHRSLHSATCPICRRPILGSNRIFF
eukprot:NODE_1172_length_1623_cov_39.567513_g1103_i0.p1 GENE.NODE_1172_length_1623_cov_39.567513_g1103_i0~~NODE_1172_length_1623_cov_39.567513_g1103_i0.p1  ORF type:complete len:517 (+),score=93.48 NODE_1172_length_1623_cov_39.567513_g1103_i0:227-1552(+)